MPKIDKDNKFKGRKYVYYKHLISGRQDMMNWWEWERIQRDKYRARDFQLVRVLDLDDPQEATSPVASGGGVQQVPIKVDPLECPLCGFIANTEKALKAHKGKAHGEKKSSVSSKAGTNK